MEPGAMVLRERNEHSVDYWRRLGPFCPGYLGVLLPAAASRAGKEGKEEM